MPLLECGPVPESRGALREPPRRPPTAIGTGRLPPFPPLPRPGLRGRLRRRRHTRAGRVGLGLLALVFGLAGLQITSKNNVVQVVAVSSLAASVDVGLHALTGSVRPWRDVVGPGARRLLRPRRSYT